MKKVLITQSNYIPWKGYFDAICEADVFVLYDEMQYTKRDWRNRNKIKTANGLKWLTVPVEVKGKFEQKINETKVSDANWGANHWNILKNNYSKAKYFKENEFFVKDLYLNCEEDYLSEINFYFLKGICAKLGITTEFIRSKDFELKGGQTEKLVNICLELNATDYITGPAAKNYMDESLFADKGLEINYLDYSSYPEYNQLYEGFEHGVSILDLIFNEGVHARDYLKCIKSN